jgi:hypothetical protein
MKHHRSVLLSSCVPAWRALSNRGPSICALARFTWCAHRLVARDENAVLHHDGRIIARSRQIVTAMTARPGVHGSILPYLSTHNTESGGSVASPSPRGTYSAHYTALLMGNRPGYVARLHHKPGPAAGFTAQILDIRTSMNAVACVGCDRFAAALAGTRFVWDTWRGQCLNGERATAASRRAVA